MLNGDLMKINVLMILIATFSIRESVGITMSAATNSQLSFNFTRQVSETGNTTLIATLYPDIDRDYVYGIRAERNVDYNCAAVSVLSFSMIMATSSERKGTCKYVSANFEPHPGYIVFQGTISNVNDTAYTMYLHLVVLGSNWSVKADGANLVGIVPPKSTCTASIENLNIGNVVSGASINKTLPFTITGNFSSKSFVISGTDIQSDGKLNLGGSSSGVKVYPASNYISGSTWNAGSSSGSIPLTVDASAGKAGTWTSSLLATLTCS